MNFRTVEQLTKREKSTALGLPNESSEQAVRKQVTVLFCDVADYTSRAISMDPEDLADEIRVFQTLCTQVADKYHGNISNFLGDGILVLFGHPHSNEFDAEHAVRAGLEMVAEIEANNASFEWRNRSPISIRIGIATSLVVVGERAGKQRNQDELIFGEAPNLAARLQSLAQPNTVITSLRTRRLVGSAFQFKDLGEHDLKGFNQAVPAWQLIKESTFQGRNNRSLKRVTTQFISRKQELALLTDCYEKAISGNPMIVKLDGEAGVGKSRLLRVFEKTLDKQNINRIRITSSPYYSSTPLRSVVEEFYRWLALSVEDSLKDKQQKIHTALDQLLLNDDESVALLHDLLDVEPPEQAQPINTSAEEKHHRTILLLSNIVIRLSRARPLLLIVEDLHWSDPTTIELLHHLSCNKQQHRIFIILTSRPKCPTPWQQSESFINLHLGGLDRTDSAELIASVFADTGVTDKVKKTLIEKAGGVPLYLEECCWHILNQLQQRQDGQIVDDEFVVPDSLQDSLNARLDLLGDAKSLAQLAATFNSFFTYSNLKKVALLNGIEADVNMDALLQTNLIRTIPKAEEDRYVFHHMMFQEAAYQSLLKKTRQRYHLQIAELFLHEYPSIEKSQPELVAYHYSRTDQIEIAVDLWIQAARISITKSTLNEALEHINLGIDLLTQLPSTPINKKRELELLLNLAVCLTLRSGYYGKKVSSTYKRSMELANEVGDTEQQWSAIYGFWRCLICQAEFGLAIKSSVKLKRLSEVLEDRLLYMTSLGIQALTRLFGGKFLSAEKYFDDSVKYYDHTENKNIGIRFGQDPYVTIQGLGAVNRLIRNDYEQSRLEIQKSVDVARSIGHPYTVAETLRLAAVHAHISRDMISLRRYTEEAIEISEKYGFGGILAASNIFMAFSNIVTYGDNNAIKIIQRNLEIYKEKYAFLLYPYFKGLLAEAYLCMHRFQEAFTEANHVLLLIEKFGEVWITVPMMQIRAEAAAWGTLCNAEEVKTWYLQAEKIANQQHAELFLQRLQQSKLELLKNVGQPFSQTTFEYQAGSVNDSLNTDPDTASLNHYIVDNENT